MNASVTTADVQPPPSNTLCPNSARRGSRPDRRPPSQQPEDAGGGDDDDGGDANNLHRRSRFDEQRDKDQAENGEGATADEHIAEMVSSVARAHRLLVGRSHDRTFVLIHCNAAFARWPWELFGIRTGAATIGKYSRDAPGKPSGRAGNPRLARPLPPGSSPLVFGGTSR